MALTFFFTNMMHYYYGYGPGFVGNSYGMMGNPDWIFWPFVFAGALLAFVIGVIWVALAIWALVDVFKNKPPHSLAWVFVILFGHIMGPLGYYFIVARDRMNRK